ncbi:MAG: hypothetical protein AAF125_20105 [Chloroflexota bacterium]
MKVIENQPQRLTLQDRSVLFGAMFVVGGVLWLVVVIGTAVRGALDLSARTPMPDQYWMKMYALGLWILLGAVGTWLALQTARSVLGGTTCTFDRSAETVTVTRYGWFNAEQQQHSLYGVSHAYVEQNDELECFALYLALRSGDRVLIGVGQAFDRPDIEAALASIRAFLRGR